MKIRKKVLAGLIASGVAVCAHAVQLGPVSVHSRQGQPLVAEVPLDLGPGESQVSAKVAGEGTFSSLGFAYGPVIRSTSTKIVDRDGHKALQIFSAKAVEIPALNLVIEISSDRGMVAKTLSLSIPDNPKSPAQAKPEVSANNAQSSDGKSILDTKKRLDVLEQSINTLKTMAVQQDTMIEATKQEIIKRQEIEKEMAAQVALATLTANEAARPWYEKATYEEWVAAGLGGIILTLIGGWLSSAFIGRPAPTLEAKGQKIRLIGLADIPLEGELIRGRRDFQIEVRPTPPLKDRVLNRLGLQAIPRNDAAPSLPGQSTAPAAAEPPIAATEKAVSASRTRKARAPAASPKAEAAKVVSIKPGDTAQPGSNTSRQTPNGVEQSA